MPLLENKPLEKHQISKELNSSDKVFYCELTNEIFTDYEEYCNRIITCNSLIWTCAITGKSNLTYQEALTSEENALKGVKDFPASLRFGLLYLATCTKRKNFIEMADDVFNFAKDRFFIGECLEANFENECWKFAHVIKITAPTEQEILEYVQQKNILPLGSNDLIPGHLYKYTVEKLDEDDKDEDIDPIVKVITGDKLKRRKGVYNKEKNKIFLKQFAEPKKNSKWGIQSNILAKYNITNTKFNKIFVGKPPVFVEPKKMMIVLNKIKQQSLDKFLIPTDLQKSRLTMNEYFEKMNKKKLEDKLKKTNDTNGKVVKHYQNSIDKTVMLAKKEALKQEAMEARNKKLEELKQRREKEREEKQKLANFVKEWERKREDLECEDLKDLPTPTPVDCKIPNEYFGDLVMIMEFFTAFRDVLKVKDFFPFGLKFDLVERALVDVEIAGPFSDILQLLLVSLFYFQEQEDDEIQNTRSYKSIDLNIDEVGDVSTAEAIKLATCAANWSRHYHGVHLKELALDVYTLSEILRLHLLSSGGRAGETSSKWRYQERGGYTSTDDPGLHLRLNHPHIFKFLSVKSVGELPIADKIKVLSCLMNQILTYAELRDVMDERYEKVRVGKNELKNDQLMEAKRERENLAQKQKERKEAKEKGETYIEETEEQKLKYEKEINKKKVEFQKRYKDLQDAAMGVQVLPLGQDRAHRRFWMFSSLPGLFVEDDERWPGTCLPQPTPTNQMNQEEDTMSYVRKLFEEERSGGSDKENEGDSSQPLGGVKKKLLGETNSTNELSSNVSSMLKSPVKEEIKCTSSGPSLICTADETCPVHCVTNRTKWMFYYTENDVSNLINQLNNRGYREHNLRKTLLEEKDRLIASVSKCPVHKLNKHIPIVPELQLNTRGQKGSAKGYENANFKFPSGTPIDEIFELQLRDVILDIEEKIFLGGLGSLKVKNRQVWRSSIENLQYDKQCDNLTWTCTNLNKKPVVDKLKLESDNVSRPDTPCSIDSGTGVEINNYKHEQNPTVKNLASAILQIAQCIEPKYRQKPLPYEDKRKDDKLTSLERWESSLMSSTSFSQLYLHIVTLENSIQWKKSALKARCNKCRRGGDPENMLLCDGCDKGFHLYCLKPKLTSIPTGDWFCLVCRPKEKVERPRRSRKLFLEESDEDEPTEDDDEDEEDSEDGVVFSRSGRRVKRIIDDDRYKKVDKNDSDYQPYPTRRKKVKKFIQVKTKSGRIVKRKSSVQSDDLPLSKTFKK